MCSSFRVHATLKYSTWASASTTVCATVLGGQVADVYGITFSDAKNCTTLDHRQACTHPPLLLRTIRFPSQLEEMHPTKCLHEHANAKRLPLLLLSLPVLFSLVSTPLYSLAYLTFTPSDSPHLCFIVLIVQTAT